MEKSGGGIQIITPYYEPPSHPLRHLSSSALSTWRLPLWRKCLINYSNSVCFMIYLFHSSARKLKNDQFLILRRILLASVQRCKGTACRIAKTRLRSRRKQKRRWSSWWLRYRKKCAKMYLTICTNLSCDVHSIVKTAIWRGYCSFFNFIDTSANAQLYSLNEHLETSLWKKKDFFSRWQ